MEERQEQERPSFFGRLWRAIIGPLLLLFFSFLAVTGWVAQYAFGPGPSLKEPSAVVRIPSGTAVREIGERLAGAGLVHVDLRFVLVTRIMGVGGRLPAGEFRLTSGQTPVDLLRELVRARPLHHKVTIAEGLSAAEIATLLAADGWCESERFMDLVRDASFIRSLKITGARTLEGYLYPDTYYLLRGGRDAEKLIRMMVANFRKVYARLASDYSGPFNRHELVTLASIVEKETGTPGERPTIAGVFYNRLKRRMRLQSDPTVIYGINNFSGNLTRKDLKTPSPYNTYMIPALPPGPICNPGRGALEAVFRPDRNRFLYFVSKNNGSHQFSKTLKEHNRAVVKYQKRRRGR